MTSPTASLGHRERGSAVTALVSVIAALLIIGAVRVLDVYLPEAVFGDDHVWVVYLILGAAFSVAGGVCWRRRKSPTRPTSSGGGEERPA